MATDTASGVAPGTAIGVGIGIDAKIGRIAGLRRRCRNTHNSKQAYCSVADAHLTFQPEAILAAPTEIAPYAVHQPGPREHAESPPTYRCEFQRDRDRIVHSAAFRRLEYKTQVFVNHEGDMFRTRLTHSMEVAQIARTVARSLGLNEDLTEAIALAHDLGHTPFGHAGQDALNTCMREFGGFEHNLQSLRVVDVLEESYPRFQGLNLLFETREGILKHCSRKHAQALGNVGKRFLNDTQPCLEAQLANLADEVAYNHHDLDDGLRAELLNVEDLREIERFRLHYDDVLKSWPSLNPRRVVHEVIRRMINEQVGALIESSRAMLRCHQPQSVQQVREAGRTLIDFDDASRESHRQLKRFLRHRLYRHYRVHRMARKARTTVSELYQALVDDVRLLPPEAQQRATDLKQTHGTAGIARAVADYIAGMTDRFAIAEHRRLFSPSELT